jgi:hypothetical protein
MYEENFILFFISVAVTEENMNVPLNGEDRDVQSFPEK